MPASPPKGPARHRVARRRPRRAVRTERFPEFGDLSAAEQAEVLAHRAWARGAMRLERLTFGRFAKQCITRTRQEWERAGRPPLDVWLGLLPLPPLAPRER
jgi:hypothetical protein